MMSLRNSPSADKWLISPSISCLLNFEELPHQTNGPNLSNLQRSWQVHRDCPSRPPAQSLRTGARGQRRLSDRLIYRKTPTSVRHEWRYSTLEQQHKHIALSECTWGVSCGFEVDRVRMGLGGWGWREPDWWAQHPWCSDAHTHRPAGIPGTQKRTSYRYRKLCRCVAQVSKEEFKLWKKLVEMDMLLSLSKINWSRCLYQGCGCLLCHS